MSANSKSKKKPGRQPHRHQAQGGLIGAGVRRVIWKRVAKIAAALAIVLAIVEVLAEDYTSAYLTAQFEELKVELTGETGDALGIDADFMKSIQTVSVDGQPSPSTVTGIRFKANDAADCQAFRFIASARDRGDPKAGFSLVVKAQQSAARGCGARLVFQNGDGGETYPSFSTSSSLEMRFRSKGANAALSDQRARCVEGRAVSIEGAGVPGAPAGVARHLRVCGPGLTILTLTPEATDPDGDLKVALKASGSFDLIVDGDPLAWYRRLRLVQRVLEKLK
jgi:hypothetical protein